MNRGFVSLLEFWKNRKGVGESLFMPLVITHYRRYSRLH